MRIIGIDPGVAGAVALIDEAGTFIAAVDMPTVLANKSSTKQMVDAFGLAAILRPHAGADGGVVAVIENVQPMPSIGRGGEGDEERRSMGAASAFAFGKSCGIPLGVLAGLGIPVEFLAPARWKRFFGLGREKDSSRELALRTWPAATEALRLKKHHNRADALLMACWYRNVHLLRPAFEAPPPVTPVAVAKAPVGYGPLITSDPL